jgi:hypothetical protein
MSKTRPELKRPPLRSLVTDAQRKALRKIKTLPDVVKVIVYGGNIGGPAMTVQFDYDLRTYNLWEALLYVEGYEPSKYIFGTAAEATKAAIATLQLDDLRLPADVDAPSSQTNG